MAKLWASQQRLADRQSQVDELRARRYRCVQAVPCD